MTKVIEYPLTPNIRAFNVVSETFYSVKVFAFSEPPAGIVCSAHRTVGARCEHIEAVEEVLASELLPDTFIIPEGWRE